MNPNLNGNVVFWIQQQTRRVETSAAGNQARLRGAKTLSDAVRLGDVSIPAEIRALRHTIQGLKTLDAAVERRLREFVEAAIEDIRTKATAEEARAQRGRLMRECEVLRGKYAPIYRYAETESARHVYLKEKAAKSALPQDTPPVP